jgi:hypothetical protein
VINDPLNRLDPLGLYDWDAFWKGFAAGSSGGATAGSASEQKSPAFKMGAAIGSAWTIGTIANTIGTPVGPTAAAPRAVGTIVRSEMEAAPILGNPQVTRAAGVETTHASTSARLAAEESTRPDAVRVHQNQTVTTITEGEQRSAVRPDVATVTTEGKVDVTEVLSPGQEASSLADKYKNALGDKAGRIECVKPDSC